MIATHAAMSRFPACLCALLILACSFSTAHAHKLAPALMQIDAVSDTQYTVLWRTGLTSQNLQPEWPVDCTITASNTVHTVAARDERMQWTCPQGLAGQQIGVSGLLASRTTTLLRLQLPNRAAIQQLLTVEQPRYRVPANHQIENVWRQYLALGAQHIWSGIDHLLLVLGLFLLAAQWRPLLRNVTAFTLGHSLTLAVVALGWFSVSAPLVEISIALTLLLMALALSRPTNQAPRYWPVIALFGLIHGMGFAGALTVIGLPQTDLLPALLSFNAGIELGQIAILAGMAALFAIATRLHGQLPRMLRQLGIYAIGSLAVYWCLDRTGQFLLAL